MNSLLIVAVFAVILLAVGIQAKTLVDSDGMGCVACAAIVVEADRAIEMGTEEIKRVMGKACDLFPGKVGTACHGIVKVFGNKIIGLVKDKLEPDQVCQSLGLCDKCHIAMPKHMLGDYYAGKIRSSKSHQMMQHIGRHLSAIYTHQMKTLRNEFRKPPAKEPHLDPNRLFDWDGDGFATVHNVARGADWKGRDCNDLSSHTHPGLYEHNSILDYNCNGVKGKTNLVKGESYEDKYCNSYEHDRSIFFFGDSASAGFSINKEWLEFKNLSHVVPAILNEFSWPSKAFTSGYDDDTHESLYIDFAEHNHCAHRQYQNVAYNGAMMLDLPNQIKYLHVLQDDDRIKPGMVFLGYIGNDICEETLEDMTTPEQFRAALEKGLAMLDEKLPSNSRVLVFGLVDGEILFDLMHNATHPISLPDLKITYEDFYEFLTCTGANPCNTWLTNNATQRHLASERARELDAVIQDVLKTNTYKHFKTAYLDFSDLIDEGFKVLEKRGHSPQELVNGVDGFHPSLDVGHPIIARVMWDHMKRDFGDDFIGPANPHNAEIRKRFGNQGGH